MFFRKAAVTSAFTSVLAALAAASFFSDAAYAQNCRAMPMGQERRACAMRENPARFEAKKNRCDQLAVERGFVGKGAGRREFMQSCMRGRGI